MSDTSKKPPRALGVVPARGGSKRLKRKNMRLIAGKPLVSWTIEAARNSTMLTDYLVSTEDDEIHEFARGIGANVPFKRPASLSGDEIRNIDVCLHALDYMASEGHEPYDIIVLLQPTCPIRTPEHIDQAVRTLWASDLQTVASVKGPFKKRDPNLKAIDDDGVMRDFVPLDPDSDWRPFYVFNASIYAARTAYFREHRKLVSDQQVPLLMDEFHSLDIDTEADLVVAEAALRYILERKATS